MMTITAPAALPEMQSSISIGGGPGAPARVKLDIYCKPEDIATLYRMQGAPLEISLKVVSTGIGDDGLYTPEGK